MPASNRTYALLIAALLLTAVAAVTVHHFSGDKATTATQEQPSFNEWSNAATRIRYLHSFFAKLKSGDKFTTTWVRKDPDWACETFVRVEEDKSEPGLLWVVTRYDNGEEHEGVFNGSSLEGVEAGCTKGAPPLPPMEANAENAN